jgi:phosphatidylglycerophosphatase C
MGSGDPVATQAGQETDVGPASVVVFDFDGTLVRRDSFFDFSCRYCGARPWRLLLVALVAPFALVVALRSPSAASSLLLWAMTTGGSTRSFVLALRRYASQRLPAFANEATFAEFRRELALGGQMVIATGTLPLMVRGVFRARQLPVPRIVGSRLRRRFGGLIAETHCTGAVKVSELRRRYGVVEWATVYTDSLADRPLLQRAQHIVLVSPSRRTLRITRDSFQGALSLRVLRPT